MNRRASSKRPFPPRASSNGPRRFFRRRRTQAAVAFGPRPSGRSWAFTEPKRSPSRQRPKPRQSQHPLPAPRLKPPPPLGGFFIGLFRRSEALPLWPATGTEALRLSKLGAGLKRRRGQSDQSRESASFYPAFSPEALRFFTVFKGEALPRKGPGWGKKIAGWPAA